ncbi:hypothetical protein [Paenibacillus sabinae]|uniref:RiboL-PSP-HEPN domain-containing protein n=1 Tax=Paenibacillus sabinae T27 TaxID=1268072 RepID=X4ZZK2_9BACL|nr:hypothetical protein [Paenibacillus sabinae]AHV97079.1 hypothetical protein PSAB_10745 [Paenibacillus sabinae T27]
MNQSAVCSKFKRMLNDEIAAGEFFQDLKLESALKKDLITPEGKQSMGLPVDAPLSMYDLTRPALEALPKFRFMYLVSLFEAFVQEYIAERKGISLDDLKNSLTNERSTWQRLNGHTSVGSTSYYNVRFVNWLLNELYSIQIQSVIETLTLEMGDLRKCLVHHGGEITKQDFVDGLKATCLQLGLPSIIGTKVTVTKKLMSIYIEDFRRILNLCDF